jgi:hypothetical protein
MERNHEDDGPTYALSAGAKRIESGLVLINALSVGFAIDDEKPT